MEKQCPFFLINRPRGDCLRENCAWWVEADAQEKEHGVTGCCAILSLTCIPDAIDEVREAVELESAK